MYYQSINCSTVRNLEKLVQAVEYSSFGVLILSALPCKIVGLELFGVLQLSFFALGSLDNINLMQSPLKILKATNGYSLDLGQDTTTARLLQVFTSERINAIDYRANFIRNCNVMFLLVVAVMVIAFFLYLITWFYKFCCPCFYVFSERIFKEVLLTLILFNMLNFAYSTGIHFKYAPKEDPLFIWGTLAAVSTLLIPLLMVFILQCTEESGFG